MTDIASSKKKIQIEETQYKSAVSESTSQKMGGAINHILDNSVNQIGDVVQSFLSQSAFQARRGNNWVLMSGQSIAGSDLATEEGITTLPNATGNSAFFRQGGSLGTFQSDTYKEHAHGQRSQAAAGVTDILVDDTSTSGGLSGREQTPDGTSANKTQIFTDTSGSSETRPKNYQFNFFIKINNDPT